jgi:hypothetical protein
MLGMYTIGGEVTGGSGTVATAVLPPEDPTPGIDATKVPASRTVAFPGAKRVIQFSGGKRIVGAP